MQKELFKSVMLWNNSLACDAFSEVACFFVGKKGAPIYLIFRFPGLRIGLRHHLCLKLPILRGWGMFHFCASSWFGEVVKTDLLLNVGNWRRRLLSISFQRQHLYWLPVFVTWNHLCLMIGPTAKCLVKGEDNSHSLMHVLEYFTMVS